KRQPAKRVPQRGSHRAALLHRVPGAADDASLHTHQMLHDVGGAPGLAGGHASEAAVVQSCELGEKPTARLGQRSVGLFEIHPLQPSGISTACTSGRALRNMTSSSSST